MNKVFLIILIILTLIIIIPSILLFNIYSRRKSIPWLYAPLKKLVRLLLKFSSMLGEKRDRVRRVFIELSNIIEESAKSLYGPDKLIVILPHCLQNMDCKYRITNGIENCRECGKCVISNIKRITRERGVEAVVVTGGTAARSILRKKRPHKVLAVACERDLASGIADAGILPVMGILNERPQGPCFNTTLDIDKFERSLDKILGKKAQDK